jgi:hypothetical protein
MPARGYVGFVGSVARVRLDRSPWSHSGNGPFAGRTQSLARLLSANDELVAIAPPHDQLVLVLPATTPPTTVEITGNVGQLLIQEVEVIRIASNVDGTELVAVRASTKDQFKILSTHGYKSRTLRVVEGTVRARGVWICQSGAAGRHDEAGRGHDPSSRMQEGGSPMRDEELEARWRPL